MKKILCLLVLCIGFATMSDAQSVTQFLNPSGVVGKPDTITNAATTYLTSRAYGSGNIAVQLDLKKVSGTVAGSASLQASIDHATTPVYWFAVPGTDTLTLTDGDNVKSWSIPSNYLHYRVRITTTGTQKNAPKAFHYLKPLSK